MKVKFNRLMVTIIIAFCVLAGMAFVLIREGRMARKENVQQLLGEKQAYRVWQNRIYDNTCIGDNRNAVLLPDSLMISQGYYQIGGLHMN